MVISGNPEIKFIADRHYIVLTKRKEKIPPFAQLGKRMEKTERASMCWAAEVHLQKVNDEVKPVKPVKRSKTDALVHENQTKGSRTTTK